MLKYLLLLLPIACFSQDTIRLNIYNNTAYQVAGWNNWKPFNQKDVRIPSPELINTKGERTGITVELNTQEGLRDMGSANKGIYREASYSQWPRTLKIVGLKQDKTYDVWFYGKGSIFGGIPVTTDSAVKFENITSGTFNISHSGKENILNAMVIIQKNINRPPLLFLRDTTIEYSGVKDFVPIDVVDLDGDSLRIECEEVSPPPNVVGNTQGKYYFTVDRADQTKVYKIAAIDPMGARAEGLIRVLWVYNPNRLINIQPVGNIFVGISIEGEILTVEQRKPQ